MAPNRVVRDVFLRASGVLGHDAQPGKVADMAQVDASGYRLMLEVGGNVSAANASRIVSAAGYLAMTGYGSMFEPLAPGSGGEFLGAGRMNASGGYVSRRTAPGGGFRDARPDA